MPEQKPTLLPPRLPENRHELNLLARKALLELDQKPDAQELYCLQLIRWGLESGNLKLDWSRLRGHSCRACLAIIIKDLQIL